MNSLAFGNLSTFGVEELDSETASNVEGGNPFIIGIIGNLVAAVIWDIANDLSGAQKALSDGYHTVAG